MHSKPLLFLATAALAAAQSPQPEPPLELGRLVTEALDRNPEILAAQKRVEAARQRPAQQSTLPDPTVSFGWQSNGNPLPGAGLGSQPTSNIGGMVSQEIPWPGKLRLRGEIASKDAAAELEAYRAVRLNVLSRLTQAYHRLHHAWVMRGVLEQNRDLLRNLLSVTEARYSVGKVPQQDVFRAETQLSIFETRLVQIDRDRHAREAEINSLLDRPLNAPLGRPEEMEPSPLHFTLEELAAKAGDAAPVLRRDRKMIQRNESAFNLAHADRYPDYTLNAGYYNMGGMPAMYMFRADVRIPLLRRVRPEEAEQAAGVAEARHSYEADSQSLLYRMKDDYLTAETAWRLMDMYRRTILPQARFTIESSLSSYENGAGDFITVLNNYMAVFDAEMAYHEQMQEYHLALARLSEMTGVELEH